MLQMLRGPATVKAAAAGATVGASAAAWAFSPPRQRVPLCGTYELVSFTPNGGKQVSGQLVYKPDGSMSTHFLVTPASSSAGASAGERSQQMYTGYAGRWFLHEASSLCPPHGGDLVEHDVVAASHRGLVGKTLRQAYTLSENGRKLTTEHSSFLGGQAQHPATLEWRRL